MGQERLEKLISELSTVSDYFNLKTLNDWANEVSNCRGGHDSQNLLKNVVRITSSPEFREIRGTAKGHLIPDASFEKVEGISELVARGFIQDIILIAELMTCSRIVHYGLTEGELEDIYKHHCVEVAIETGNRVGLSIDDSLIVLAHYIQKVRKWFGG